MDLDFSVSDPWSVVSLLSLLCGKLVGEITDSCQLQSLNAVSYVDIYDLKRNRTMRVNAKYRANFATFFTEHHLLYQQVQTISVSPR